MEYHGKVLFVDPKMGKSNWNRASHFISGFLHDELNRSKRNSFARNCAAASLSTAVARKLTGWLSKISRERDTNMYN